MLYSLIDWNLKSTKTEKIQLIEFPTDLSGEIILESDVIDFSEDAFSFDSTGTTFDVGLGNDSSFKLIQEQFEILDLRLIEFNFLCCMIIFLYLTIAC